MLYRASKMTATECKVEKPEGKDTNVDLIAEGLSKFKPVFDKNQSDLKDDPTYTEAQFKKDLENNEKLLFDSLFPDAVG